MNISSFGRRTAACIAAVGAALTCFAAVAAPPALPEGYISGVVSSSKGPEAGVWVIAETTETRTPLIKIVVTGDDGRYVLPQLPTATYYVWVRGYGLVDSAKVKGRPGDTALNLTAVVAPTPADAAKVYPGNYWLSLLQPPPKSAFPGTGDKGNGMPPTMDSQAHWIYNIKSGCNFCHELGTQRYRARSATWTTSGSRRRRKPGSIAHSSACAVARWPARWRSGARRPARRCWPIGPRVFLRASCRRSRRVRPASSATSS
jgi:hypothetical protein